MTTLRIWIILLATLLANPLFAQSSGTQFISNRSSLSNQGAVYSQKFTLRSPTSLVLRKASQYTADIGIFSEANFAAFAKGQAASGFAILNGQSGTKYVSLSAGTYVVAIRNGVAGANAYTLELDYVFTRAGQSKIRSQEGAQVVSANGGKLVQPFTIASGQYVWIDGANAGLDFYLIDNAEVSNFTAGRTFKHYEQYSTINDGFQPGAFHVDLPPGSYALAFHNPRATPSAVVYSIEWWTGGLVVTPPAVAPAILTQPSSRTVTAGQSAVFSVVASGTAPLSYQWRKNGTDIRGANSSSLSLSGVVASDAATYTVVVTNTAGSIASAAAVLTVTAASVLPSILTHPVSQSVTIGQSVVLSVTASGSAPLSYQWRKGGANIPGATSSELRLPSVTTADSGGYNAVVTNPAGSVVSAAAVITIVSANSSPTIQTQPVSQSAVVGGAVVFSVAAVGQAPLTYQWRKNGTVIAGATGSTLSFANVAVADGAGYTVVVTNTVGSITSATATLTVSVAAAPPTIQTPPGNRTVMVGQSVTLSVTAVGTAPLSYQWRKNGTSIPGATGSSLNLANVALADGASYAVVVTNSLGSATSASAVVTVNPAATMPAIQTQPASQTVVFGQSVTLSVVAGGTAPLSYQWRKNGAVIPGAIGSSLNLPSVTAVDAASYAVVVINPAGSVTSTAAVLTVVPASSRLSNVSILTTLDDFQELTVGFTMRGGEKDVLVRAIGPGLTAFQIPTAMADPILLLYKDSVAVEGNDDWSGSDLSHAAAAVGAFGLVAESYDSAVLRAIEGGHTARIGSYSGEGGTVLVEVYDAGAGATTRLVNVSALNQVGTGPNIMIAGFNLAGVGPKRLLIRAIGPGLTRFGVTGVILDPTLEIYSAAGVKLYENDNWDQSLSSAFDAVGAFALTAGSRDSAIVLNNLTPGGYTVQVRGVNSNTGKALIEIYELP